VLEISSPGTSRILDSDREFIAFRGFPVVVSTREPFEGQQEWVGQLVRRDEQAVHLTQKGRTLAIPRDLVYRVQLCDR
jgi:ribosome maturation factor RimP